MSRKNKKEWFTGFRHMAIAKRITLLYGGIFTLSLLFLSGFMLLNLSSVQQNSMRRELNVALERIEEYLMEGEPLSDDAMEELLDGLYVEASVFSYDENQMFSNIPGNAPPFIHYPSAEKRPEKLREGEAEPPYLHEKDLENSGYEISVQRENQSGNVEYILESDTNQQFMLISTHCKTEYGMYRLQVFRMMSDGGYMIFNFMSKLLIVDIIGIFGAFWIGRYISRRMLKPVEAIRTAAERISIEDLSRRISTEGPEDEMKELTITFNSMIDRLDTAFQRQNQFISDASHELRTPIAVIQGYANLINRWGKSDPEILQESIESILTETDHMSALIRQLLFLAKSDQSRLPVQKRQISLNESAGELVREITLLHAERKISFREEDTVEIYGDDDLIKQLLWIHGENALKYSGKDDALEVRVWKDEKYGYISVRDEGVGISEEDMPKVFDRFYRADKSRSKEISGTGLGLAIAKWIVECHEGEILLESVPGEGTVFTDKFPLYTEEAERENRRKKEE